MMSIKADKTIKKTPAFAAERKSIEFIMNQSESQR